MQPVNPNDFFHSQDWQDAKEYTIVFFSLFLMIGMFVGIIYLAYLLLNYNPIIFYSFILIYFGIPGIYYIKNFSQKRRRWTK